MFSPATRKALLENPINRSAKRLALLAFIAPTVVVAIVIGADLRGPTFLASLLADHVLEPACNKIFGARVLFWGLLLLEVVTLGRISFAHPSREQIQRFQGADNKADEELKRAYQGTYPTLQSPLTKIGLVVIPAVIWFASYTLAYGDGNLCSDRLGVSIVNYLYIFAANVTRGASVAAGYALYYKSYPPS
jgi:hypothetical protein